MDRRDRWLLGPAGLVLVAAFVALSATPSLQERIPLFLLLYGLAFVAYAVGVARALARGGGWTKRALWWVLGVGAVARAILLPAEPVLSTDVYRYLWEGRVIVAGHNPFALSPDADVLEPMRDENYESINHKNLATIYPPLSQAVFALGARIRPDITTQKALSVLFDLATMLLLVQLLASRRIARVAVIVYAWSPLVIFETAHSGHLDAVGILFLVVALWWLGRGPSVAGMLALACSVLSKYVALVLAPYFFFRRRYAWLLLVGAAAIVLGYLPFAGAGGGLVSSLRAYGAEWHFNGLPYLLVDGLLDDPLGARRLLAVVLAAFVLVAAARQADLARFAFLAIGGVLLLSPTLYPWYVSWIVPFLCLFPSRAWILFTGLVFASYWVWVVFAATGEWRLTPLVYVIEYAPLYAMLLWGAWRRRRLRTLSEGALA